MECPIAKVEVGEVCNNKKCWFWHRGADKNCVVTDVGTTHLVAADVARIYKEKKSEVEARIERGRNKMAAWLSLVEKIENIDYEGCGVCGAPKCIGGKKCEDNRLSWEAEAKRLPLEKLIKMNPTRWYAVATISRGK